MNDLISKSRWFIMGVSMLVIMLFHCSFGILGKLGLIFSIYGHWGVDVFLFLSGFGIYHALCKNEGLSLIRFYKRRAIRIFPSTILAGTVLYTINYTSLLGVLGLNLWYIRTLVVLYACSPLIYKLCHVKNRPIIYLSITLIAVCGVLVSVPYLKESRFFFQSSISWTFARLPVFCWGILIAHYAFNLRSFLNPTALLFFLLLLILLFILHYQRHVLSSISTYLHLLPYILLSFIIPFFCLALGYAHTMTPRFISIFFEFLGKLSLEIYIVHEAVFHYVKTLFVPSYMKFSIAYGTTLVTALGLHILISQGSKIITHRN